MFHGMLGGNLILATDVPPYRLNFRVAPPGQPVSGEYRFAGLTADHPVWTNDRFVVEFQPERGVYVICDAAGDMAWVQQSANGDGGAGVYRNDRGIIGIMQMVRV